MLALRHFTPHPSHVPLLCGSPWASPPPPLDSVQEKLVRMLGTIQAMYLMVYRLTRLQEAGKMTHEMASLVKAWNTQRGREVSAAAPWLPLAPASCDVHNAI